MMDQSHPSLLASACASCRLPRLPTEAGQAMRRIWQAAGLEIQQEENITPSKQPLRVAIVGTSAAFRSPVWTYFEGAAKRWS